MSRRRQAESEHKPRGLWYFLGWGLSAGFLAFVILIGVLTIILPAVTGATPMTILTSSMRPSYPPGTLVIVKPIEPDAIRIGMPITYQVESGKDIFITHRVIAITHTSNGKTAFTLKGDANGSADEAPVLPVQVRGEVWYSIPYLGWVNTFVGGEHRGLVVPVLAGGLFLYAGYAVASSVASAAGKRKRGRQPQDSGTLNIGEGARAADSQ